MSAQRLAFLSSFLWYVPCHPLFLLLLVPKIGSTQVHSAVPNRFADCHRLKKGGPPTSEISSLRDKRKRYFLHCWWPKSSVDSIPPHRILRRQSSSQILMPNLLLQSWMMASITACSSWWRHVADDVESRSLLFLHSIIKVVVMHQQSWKASARSNIS